MPRFQCVTACVIGQISFNATHDQVFHIFFKLLLLFVMKKLYVSVQAVEIVCPWLRRKYLAMSALIIFPCLFVCLFLSLSSSFTSRLSFCLWCCLSVVYPSVSLPVPLSLSHTHTLARAHARTHAHTHTHASKHARARARAHTHTHRGTRTNDRLSVSIIVRGTVTQTVTISFIVRGNVTKTVSVSFTVRGKVTKTVSVSLIVKGKVTKTVSTNHTLLKKRESRSVESNRRRPFTSLTPYRWDKLAKHCQPAQFTFLPPALLHSSSRSKECTTAVPYTGLLDVVLWQNQERPGQRIIWTLL